MSSGADLLVIERSLYARGITLVCGIDEAGRGPLAGPVTAGAVILPEGCVIEGLDDSKKLTEKKREALYPVILKQAVAWGVGMADEKEIDSLNILNATFLAMRRALEKLGVTPGYVLVDGNRDPRLGVLTETVVKGDAKSASIAAASILAKVTRDRLMCDYDRQYPDYGFAKHKGYPTKMHYEKIAEFGPSKIHRKSFLHLEQTV